MLKLAHARALAVALPTWAWAIAWAWPHAVRAATLSSDVRLYDWTSLGWAALLGLLGGFLALIVALATDRRVVTEVLSESLRNALVSPIAGAVCYLGVQAAAAQFKFALSSEPRFLVIVAAGWAGIAFIQWARETFGASAGVLRDWLIERLKSGGSQ